jgi:methenyltetrahydrofolate cyclohydrolase
MSIGQMSLEQFLTELASKAPTPGGGSAASVMGAIGAALVSMVCNLTIGKDKYAAVEVAVKQHLGTADKLRAEITDTIALDIAAFDQVIAAYGMTRANGAEKSRRSVAIQRALTTATEVPLQSARLCAEVLKLSYEVAKVGNLNVISDAGVAAMAAYAGLKSAALNVYINAPNLHDESFASRCLNEIETLTAMADRVVAETYQLVRDKL